MTAPCPAFGFVVRVALRSSHDAISDHLAELLEKNGLSSRAVGATAGEYVVTRDGTQATNADRELVIEWARRWAGVADVRVSDLIDLHER